MIKSVGHKSVEDRRHFCDGCDSELDNLKDALDNGTNEIVSTFTGRFCYGYATNDDGYQLDLELCQHCSNKLKEEIKKLFPTLDMNKDGNFLG